MPDIQAQTPDGVTHSFPNGTPDDVIDRVIKQHIQNAPYTEAGAAANPPKPDQLKGSPLATRIGMEQAEEPSNEAIGKATGLIGAAVPLAVSPVTTAGAMAGGAIGAPIVSGGARKVVGALGGGQGAQETAGTLGGYGGLLLGGALGGGAVNAMEGLPEEVSVGGVKLKVPSWMRPNPSGQVNGGVGAPFPASPTPEETLDRAVKAGTASKLPTRMPKPAAPPVTPMTQSPNYDQYAAARDAARETAKNANINRPGWTTRLPDRISRTTGAGGEVGAGKVPAVNVIPEPRPTLPADRPGSQWSVKRTTGLVPAAKRGVPGAGDVLQNLSKVIYEPREGVGYPGPRPETPPELSGVGGQPAPLDLQPRLWVLPLKPLSKGSLMVEIH